MTIKAPRFEDWPQRLIKFLNDHNHIEFEYGINDCCLFAAKWVYECTGQQVDDFGKLNYKTAKQALTFLKRRKMNSVVDVVSRVMNRLGCPAVMPLMAQRGDIVIVENNFCMAEENTLSAAICVGSQVAAITMNGVAYVPLTTIKFAWNL